MRTTTGAGLTALALGAGLLMGTGAAQAQATPVLPACSGVGGVSYPAGLAGGTSVSDSSPDAGATITANSGADTFDPLSAVAVTFLTGPVELGTVPADDNGNASITFAVPDVDEGLHVLQFSGTRDGEARLVGICLNVEEPAVLPGVVTPPAGPAPVPGAVAPKPAVQPRVLPFTGSADLLTVSLVGAGLLALGTASVVVARRRRADGSPA